MCILWLLFINLPMCAIHTVKVRRTSPREERECKLLVCLSAHHHHCASAESFFVRPPRAAALGDADMDKWSPSRLGGEGLRTSRKGFGCLPGTGVAEGVDLEPLHHPVAGAASVQSVAWLPFGGGHARRWEHGPCRAPTTRTIVPCSATAWSLQQKHQLHRLLGHGRA